MNSLKAPSLCCLTPPLTHSSFFIILFSFFTSFLVVERSRNERKKPLSIAPHHQGKTILPSTCNQRTYPVTPPKSPASIKVHRCLTGITLKITRARTDNPIKPVNDNIVHSGIPRSLASRISSPLPDQLPLHRYPPIQVVRFAVCLNQKRAIKTITHCQTASDSVSLNLSRYRKINNSPIDPVSIV